MAAATRGPKLSIVSMDIGKNQQDVNFEQIVTLGDFKLRIDIRSNAYQFQSHARIYVWRPAQLDWSLVASIQPSEMKTPEGMYVQSNPNLGNFSKDQERLIEKAKLILF